MGKYRVLTNRIGASHTFDDDWFPRDRRRFALRVDEGGTLQALLQSNHVLPAFGYSARSTEGDEITSDGHVVNPAQRKQRRLTILLLPLPQSRPRSTHEDHCAATLCFTYSCCHVEAYEETLSGLHQRCHRVDRVSSRPSTVGGGKVVVNR